METKNIFSESGIIITLLLIAIPVIVASILVIIKAKNVLKNFLKKKELEKFNEYLKNLSPEEVQKIEQRKKELEFSLSNNELAGDTTPIDAKGLIIAPGFIDVHTHLEGDEDKDPKATSFILDGVTTNPSLIAKEGIKGEDKILQHYLDICKIV